MNRTPDDARRLLAAYDDCMAVEGVERAARMARHEREDPGIATRLRSMLAVDAGAAVNDAFGIESVVGELVAAATGAAAEGSRQAGPFTLLHLLGRGGMGEVWLAERDHDGFRQQVALKRLRSGRDTEDLRRRFVQERRILAELSHPGIARFIDGGIDDAGAPWYAMEYVQGVPIIEHAVAQGLDARARVALLAEVAEAVAYAQNHLVVHRDLKPSNILIDAEGRPRLLDFGIAKLLDTAAAGEGETAAGLRAMTPDYAAPEQILGAPVSAATDVFALGVVLYQLLTGELPHTRGAASLESLVDAVRTEVPERPSARLRRSNGAGTGVAASRTLRTLRGDLDTIALMALRREPERRYASAADFARDLRRWLDGRPIAAQADTTGYRMRKFVARHRLAVGSASAVLLALIAGFGTALWQASVARNEARRAQEQAAIAHATVSFLTEDVIRAANPFKNPLRLSVADALRRAAPAIPSRFETDPRQAGVVGRVVADSLDLAGDPVAALASVEQAQATLERAFGDLDHDALAARILRARLLNQLDRWAEARALYDAVLPRMQEPRFEAERLAVTVGLAAWTIEQRREEEGLASLGAAIPRLEALLGPSNAIYLDALGLQVAANMQLERYAEALALCERHEQEAIARDGEHSPIRMLWTKRRAQLLRMLKRFDEAREAAELALSLSIASLGEAHDATDDARLQLAIVLLNLGQFARAEALTAEVVAYRERQTGPDAERTWLAWVWHARALQGAGRPAEAEAPLRRVAERALRTLGPDDPNALGYRQVLGMYLQQTGRLDEAESVQREVLGEASRILPAGHVNIAKFAFDLARTIAARGRVPEILAFCAEWLPTWERQFGAQDSRVVEARAWVEQARAGNPPVKGTP